MLKEYSILCMLILFTIFTQTKQSCSGSATKADDCKDDSITQTEKDEKDYVHCCYVKQDKNKNGGFCEALTSKQLDNLGKYIKFKEESRGYAYKIDIDCQSSYLHLFLFTLIMQFILF